MSIHSYFRPAMTSFVSLLVVGTLGLGCGSAEEVPEARIPNFVLVTLDTTRADHLGTYGYFRNTSPSFDGFARGAVVFDRLIGWTDELHCLSYSKETVYKICIPRASS